MFIIFVERELVFFIIEKGNYELEKTPKLSSIEILIEPDGTGNTRLICTLVEPELRSNIKSEVPQGRHGSSGSPDKPTRQVWLVSA